MPPPSGPKSPSECASSTSVRAPAARLTSSRRGRSTTSPSIEKTVSQTTSAARPSCASRPSLASSWSRSLWRTRTTARTRELRAVLDRRVVLRVGHDHVLGAAQRRDRREVGEVARGEDERRLALHPVGELVLELEVQVERPVHQPGAGAAGPVPVDRAPGGFGDPRVVGQTEVVVRAEHELRLAVDHDLAPERRPDRHEVRERVRTGSRGRRPRAADRRAPSRRGRAGAARAPSRRAPERQAARRGSRHAVARFAPSSSSGMPSGSRLSSTTRRTPTSTNGCRWATISAGVPCTTKCRGRADGKVVRRVAHGRRAAPTRGCSRAGRRTRDRVGARARPAAKSVGVAGEGLDPQEHAFERLGRDVVVLVDHRVEVQAGHDRTRVAARASAAAPRDREPGRVLRRRSSAAPGSQPVP